MSARSTKKLVREGECVAEVNVNLLEAERGERRNCEGNQKGRRAVSNPRWADSVD